MKKYVVLSFILFCAFSLSAENMELTGAGTNAVNGIYEESGTYDGVPYYEHTDGGIYLYRTGGYWATGSELGGTALSVTYYYVQNGANSPDGIHFEHAGYLASSPYPTVSAVVSYAPNYALDFDGGDDYVQANTVAFSDNTLTIEAWIRPRTFNGAGDANITDLVKDANEKVVLRIGDGGIENNRLQFALLIGSTQYKLPSNTLLNASQWYHVAATYDGTNMKLYLNGSLDNSVGQTGNIDAGAGNLLIGGNATGRYMDGNIDEVKIWSTARSETDITDNICTLVDATETGLLAYYRFDDGSGTTLSDVTGNGHDGALQNMDGNSDWVNSYAMVLAEDATNITFNGFTANWDCPAEANSSFDDGYTIQYSTTSDFTSGNATTTASISEISKAITGLSDNTTYYYRVSGKRSGSSTLEYSNVKSATTTASGAPEYALDFDGSNDYVDCGALNMSGSAITLECWINADAFQASSPYISQVIGTESAGNSAFLRLGDADIPAGNKIEFALQIGAGVVQLTSISTLETGRWYHIAGVYDGSTMKIYINGVEDASVVQSGSFVSNSTFYIATANGSARCFDGSIDEVRIWSDARTPSEIQDNMCGRLEGNESGLSAYYRFDNGSGTTLSDVTSNGHNGTLYNMDNADWINSFAMVLAEDATDVTDDSFTANWSCPASSSSSYDDGYTIQYSTTSDFSSGNATTTALVSETSKAITGLSASTTYYYRVSGKRSGSGTLEYSNVKSLTTDASYAPKYALDFDGTDDFATIPDNAALSANNFTVEFWLYYDGQPQNWNGILDKGRDNGAVDWWFLTDNGVDKGIFGYDGTELRFDVEPNEWTHVAGLYNGSQLIVYVNGVQANTAVKSYTPTTRGFVIGRRTNGIGYFNGRLDEIRYWNDVRTTQEIQANMTSPLNGDETGLVAYYRFDDGSGTTLTDATSNSNNGTVTNSSWVNSYAMVLAEDATDIAETSFTANWSCPAEANSSYDDGYTIQYSTSSDFSSGNATTTALSSATSKSITGLTASTTYYYRVSGKRSGSSTLEYSNVKSVTTLSPQAPEYCLDFADSDDYVSINSVFGLGTTNVTIEAWVYLPTTSESGTIARLGTNDSGFGIGVGDGQFDNSGNELLVLIDIKRWIDPNVTIGTGWHHVAFSVGSSNEVNIYLDGVNVYTEASNPNTAITPVAPSYIGAANTNSRIFSAGKIDEVRYWSDVRTAQEIGDNMTSPLIGNESNLVAYYRLDDGSGTTVSDATSNGNNGTVTNSSWVNSYAMVLAEDATDIAETSFTANWDCPAESNSSYDDGYTIQYSTTSDFSSGNATSTALISETSKAITGLSASTTYYYRVSGKRSGSGTLEYSNVKSATTIGSFSTVVTSNADDGGTNTLRYIIANCDEGETITFNLSAGNETISLASQLSISKSLTINGDNSVGSGTDVTVQVTTPGAGGSNYRVLYSNIGSGKTLTLSNMTLKGGDISAVGFPNYYGGTLQLENGGTYTLNTITITGSKANLGGAIYLKNSTSTLSNCEISNNTSSNNGGGLYLTGSTVTLSGSTINSNTIQGGWYGGAILLTNVSTISMSECQIESNSARYGGVVFFLNSGSSAVFDKCTIKNNIATDEGGCFSMDYGNLKIKNSTLSGNAALNGHGGVLKSAGGSVIFENCTASGNSSSSQGGGMYIETNEFYGDNMYLRIVNSTFCGNTAASYPGIYLSGNKIYAYYTNSIIAYNYKSDNSAYGDIYNSNGTLYGNYNIIGAYALSGGDNTNYIYSSGQGAALFESYTTISENAIYKPVLADNGGNTETVALASNGIAIGAGVRTGEYDDNGATKYAYSTDGTNWYAVEDGSSVSETVSEITTDQRNESRRQANPCIGSFESNNYYQVWTGNSSSSWQTEANWSPASVPLATDDITIPEVSTKASTLAIGPTETADCKNLTVDNNGNLTILSTSAGTGSLIVHGTLSNSGTITSQCYLPGSAQAWHMISSPVTTSIVANSWNPGGDDDFYAWLETSPGVWVNYKNSGTSPTFTEVNGSDNFVSGKGYLVAYNSVNPTKSFTGTLNTGSKSFPLANTASGKDWTYVSGWNLMGNPYSSSIDWNLATRTQFQDNYAYMYDPNKDGGAGYVYVNGSNADAYIPPHQGFFVLATQAANGQNFTFTNSMQTHGDGDNIYKSTNDNKSITIRLSSDQYYDETQICLINTSAWQRDRYDALKMYSFDDEVPQLLSYSADNIPLAVNTIPEVAAEKSMLLGFRAPKTGTYTLSVVEMSEAFSANSIYLEDLFINSWHKLSESAYTFISEEDDISDRFVLHFGVVGIEEPTSMPPSIQLWTANHTLYLLNPNNLEGKVRVINMYGQKVLKTQLNREVNQQVRLDAPAGYYIVNVITNNGIVNKKVYLK